MKSRNEEIIERCKARWAHDGSIDEKIQSFEDRFSDWLNQIPDSYCEMVLVLIEHLEYFSRPAANHWLQLLHESLSDMGVTEDNTIYTFIKSSDGLTNSSNDYWTEYKSINHLNKYLCYEDIHRIRDDQWELIKNIILIDDFCGSGKTIEDYIAENLLLFAGKRVICITVCVMDAGKKRLEAFGESNGVKIVVRSGVIQKKVFEQGLFDDDDFAKSELIKLSTELGIPKSEHLGFHDKKTNESTQSLIAFYNNTPNNTIGIIRYDVKDGYFSLFPRIHEKRPSWQNFKQQKDRRKTTNYLNAVVKASGND